MAASSRRPRRRKFLVSFWARAIREDLAELASEGEPSITESLVRHCRDVVAVVNGPEGRNIRCQLPYLRSALVYFAMTREKIELHCRCPKNLGLKAAL